MSENTFPKNMEDLSQKELVQWLMEGFRRTVIHYGCWFREVEYQIGVQKASGIESEAGDLAWQIILKRLAGLFGFEIEDGVPKAIKNLSKEKLIEAIDAVAVNWLADDGVWFQTVEKHYGMDYAKRCNDTCWSRFSPYEAFRIKKLLGLSESPGLEGLKTALGFRLYARINKQAIEEIDETSFIFRMIDCRVQSARKRKGLADYPCKSVGMVEYPFFASAVDRRIQTECLGCPPDHHPEEWYCAWKFTLI
ncbi:MAG: cytosolic protein [Deltaproteobacteria bacterium]|nr:cytosolic protein [Deltaproteobacteria bacterium]